MSLTVRERINDGASALVSGAPSGAVKVRLRCTRRTGAGPAPAPATLLRPLDALDADALDAWALAVAVVRWPAGWAVRGALLDGAGFELGAPHVLTVPLPPTLETDPMPPLTPDHVATGARNFDRLDGPQTVDHQPPPELPTAQAPASASITPAGTGAAWSAMVLTVDRLTGSLVDMARQNNDMAARVVDLARDREGAAAQLGTALADVARGTADALGSVGRAQAQAVADVGRSATGTVGPALDAVRAAGTDASNAHHASSEATAFALGQVVDAKVEAARASAGAPPETLEVVEARENAETMRAALGLVEKVLDGRDLLDRLAGALATGNPKAEADLEAALRKLAPDQQQALVGRLVAVAQRAQGAAHG